MPRHRATSDETILTAALNTVSRLGPVRLTLADVAREAGVSPATLVQRFGSKRGLLLALAASGSNAAGVAGEFAALRAKHRSPLAVLYDVGNCMAGMAVSPEVLSNSLAFLQIDLVDPEFHKHAHAYSYAVRAEIRALLDEAVAAGEIGRCDTARLARAVQVTMGGSLLQWAIDRDGKAADRLREDLDALLHPRKGRHEGHHYGGRDRRRHPQRTVRRL